MSRSIFSIIAFLFLFKMANGQQERKLEFYLDPSLQPILNKSTKICLGEDVTIKVLYAKNPVNNEYEFCFLNNQYFRMENCVGICQSASPAQMFIEGDGIFDISYNGRDCETWDRTNITIRLRPTKTTILKIHWTAKHVYAATNCNSEFVPETTIVYNYSDEFNIEVFDKSAPVISPQNAAVYLNGPPVAITTKATTYNKFLDWFFKGCDTLSFLSDKYVEENKSDTTWFYGREIGTAIYKIKERKNSVCESDYADLKLITRPPCGNVANECNPKLISFIESQSCDLNAQKRRDHHYYEGEKTLCIGCNMDNVWDWYKSKANHQAIILTDQMLSIGRISGNNSINIAFSNQMFPNGPSEDKLIDCQELRLPRISSYLIRMAYDSNDPLAVTIARLAYAVQYKCSVNPNSFSDSIFIAIDETNRCVTNYTKPGHILYPGKVTRCLTSSCDTIKINTFGEGTTLFENNSCGRLLAAVNKWWGSSMFENVDNRTILDYKNWVSSQPDPPKREIVLPKMYDLPIELHTNWKIKKFEIQYPDKSTPDMIYFYDDSLNFNDFRSVNIVFSDSGKFIGNNVTEDFSEGVWAFDSQHQKLYTDTAVVDFKLLNDTSFSVKGNVPAMIDTSYKLLPYTMTFYKSTKEPKFFTFVGNGDWADSTQWSEKKMPPKFLLDGTTVNVNPSGPIGECVLNGKIVLTKGAKIIVMPGKKLLINGRIE